MDDATMALLREVRESPLSVDHPCDDDWFAMCMKAMDILPRRQDDQVGGRMRFAMYKRHLRDFSNEAMSYLSGEATKACHWFPTIAECFEILKAWPNRTRDTDRKGKAEYLIRKESQARMEGALELLRQRAMPQADVDALPDFWKRVADDKGFLRKLTDGTFRVWPDTLDMTETQLVEHRAMVAGLIEEGLL
jgi:hypothetical protein